MSKGKEKQVKVNIGSQNIPKAELENSAPLNTDDGKSSMQVKSESEDVMADSDWEDGPNSNLNSEIDHQNHISNNISIEIDASPGDNTAKRKPVRRASAEEKVHYISYPLPKILSDKNTLPTLKPETALFLIIGSC